MSGIEASGPIPVARLIEVVRPDDRERLGAAIVACSKNHTPVDLVHRLLRADGTLRWVHARAEWVQSDADRDCGRILGTVLDITERKMAEQVAAAELARLDRAQEVAHVGSFERDPVTDLFEVSEEGRRLFGLVSTGPVPTATLLQRIHPDDLQILKATMAAVSLEHTPFDLEFRIVLPEGTLRWAHAKGGWTTRAEDGEPRIVTTVLDITARKLAADALAFEESHDRLTGLANRTAFIAKVDSALSASQHEARQVAVLLLDVDDFKTVNDSLGHTVGDELLVDLSRRLVRKVRDVDTIARVGGDEFAVLIEAGDTRQVGEQLALRIANTLKAPFTLAEHEVKLSASIGIVVSDPVGDSGALLRDADLAMYLAKKNGKGRYEIAEAGMQERALERLVTIADLHHGVEHDEFEVYYQVIVDTQTSVPVGAEALVRWNHPTRGLVLPGAFIEIAESCGLIIPIGQWVRHQACRQLAAWRRADLVRDEFYVSVNLSACQLGDPTLVNNVLRDLDDAGLPARALVLEITETMLMVDLDAEVDRIFQLKAMGVRLALDDYGTGYSSLARLSELPIDIVKIDKSFIDNLTESTEGLALVKTVIDTAKALRLSTIAEGVENEGQRDALAKLACTYIQGYLFARPVLPALVEELFFTSFA